MGMICRPVLLHNEYVPAIVGKREYEYLVLGHHDGMTVGKEFPIDEAGSFEDMFSYNAQYEGAQSSYSTQFFFGLHDDNNTEKLFWESDFPFTFVSFIQFEGRQLSEYQGYLENQQYVIAEKEVLQLPDQIEDIRTVAYYALDSSDIILAIKCRSCKTGTQIINNLHQDIQNSHPFRIRNSYSILAINRSYIDNEEKRILVDGSIEQLELRVIERKKGSINKLYEILQTTLENHYSEPQVDRKGLLGTEDEAIIIKNVLWKDLLLLYKEENGILLNSNEASQRYAAAITTKMLYSIKENKEIEVQPSNTPNTPFWDYLHQKVEKIYKDQNTASALAERKNLMMLINALRKIEYSYYAEKTFNDYCFYTIMMPTAMFVKLRECESHNSSEYYKFIKYIKLCMQNFTKPDRVYQQIADFNIRYFDIPSKLIALYNAFLYYAKRVLNVDSPGQYEFLLCPGMNKKTEVKEFYQGTDSYDAETTLKTMKSHHLFKVEIPESHAYNPKLMFIMLGHEVSHFVGRTIRKREDRFEGILKMSGRMVVVGLKERIGYTNEFEPVCLEESAWNDIESKVVHWLRFYIESQLDSRYLEEIEYNPDDNSLERIERQRNYYELFYRHTSTLKILLKNSINKILLLKKNEVFDAFLWKEVDAAINSQKISYDKREQYYEKQKTLLEKCIDSFSGIGINQMENTTVANGIEEIMFLLEECYADISCILLLHLSLEDYLAKLVETLQTTGHKVNDVSETEIIARIAIVMSVMNHEMDTEENLDKSFVWNDKYFMWKDSEILDKGDIKVLELQSEAFDFAQGYIQDQANIKPGTMTGDIQRIIRDKKILVEVIRYLLKCRREYYKRVSFEEEKKVQRFYKLAQISDPADFFVETASILENYEKDIYEEIQKLIESEEGNHDR